MTITIELPEPQPDRFTISWMMEEMSGVCHLALITVHAGMLFHATCAVVRARLERLPAEEEKAKALSDA
jgi:hypothetical protein